LSSQLSTVLDEANVLGVAAEALPAAHEPVLPDQAMRVAANTANPGSGAVVLGVRVPHVGVSHGGGGGGREL
jgi:hypothetical protein